MKHNNKNELRSIIYQISSVNSYLAQIIVALGQIDKNMKGGDET